MPEDTLEDEVVVEAPTTEGALAEVAARLGPDARIESAEKLLRGGVAGFFQREVVQVRAVRAGAEKAEGERPAALDQLLSDLRAGVEGEERSFSEVLRERLNGQGLLPEDEDNGHSPVRDPDAAATPFTFPTADPATTVATTPAEGPTTRAAWAAWADHAAAGDGPATPQAPAATTAPGAGTDPAPPAPPEALARPAWAADRPPPPSPAPASPPVTAAQPEPAPAPEPAPVPEPARARAPRGREVPAGGPVWRVDVLVRLGLPRGLVAALEDLDPAEDLRCAHALADALATLCGPLPEGDQLLVGPCADVLAERLGLPVCRAGDEPPLGSAGVRLGDGRAERAWLAELEGERWLHLVIGGGPYRRLLFQEPAAVSWVGRPQLPEAVALAAELDLILGWGLDGNRRPPQRAIPSELALAIRALLPRA